MALRTEADAFGGRYDDTDERRSPVPRPAGPPERLRHRHAYGAVMAALGDRLVGLLEGDFVRLETESLSLTAEVVTNEAGAVGDRSAADGHTIAFMPVGEAATAVEADRFHVTVKPADDAGWHVGALVGEVFDETALAYDQQLQGDLTAVERLEIRE